MAGLMRSVKHTLWNNTSQSAGATTDSLDVSRVEFISAFIEVSSATTIDLEVETVRGWRRLESLSFTDAGHDWFHIWATAIDKIRFRTSAATTITIQVFLKT